MRERYEIERYSRRSRLFDTPSPKKYKLLSKRLCEGDGDIKASAPKIARAMRALVILPSACYMFLLGSETLLYIRYILSSTCYILSDESSYFPTNLVYPFTLRITA